MILYHGSNVQIDAIELRRCNRFKDFGQAFYLSADKSQAEEIAQTRRTFLEVHQLLILLSSTSKCFQKAFSITKNFIITVLNGRSLFGTTAMRNALSFIPIITISFMVQ